jgi:hypothetical protein
MSDLKKIVMAYRVLKRNRTKYGSWPNWVQIYTDESEITVEFDFDENTISFGQREKYELSFKGLDAGKDSYRGNYLSMKCLDNSNRKCVVTIYGAVEPYREYKKIFIEYDTFQISYFYHEVTDIL